jgi:hypothetical protein
LPGGFGPTIERWIARAEVLLHPVYRLYLGTVYDPQIFLEQRLLSLVQALEAYPRRTTAATDLPEDEHEKRLEAILGAVPEGHREWLEGKLRYSNESNLRKRINDIFEEHPQTSDSVVGISNKDKKSFVNVIDTRNYRTHFDENLEGRAARGEDLHRINHKLSHLMEMCLIAEIGFEEDDIK